MNFPGDPLFDAADFHSQSNDGWDFTDLVGLLGRSFFQGQHSSGSFFGSPIEDAHGWIEQTTPFTCAVVAQEMILHAFGCNVSEAQLTYEAAANGWLTDGGTSLDSLARLLDLHGVPSHVSYHGTVDALVAELAQGHKIIAALDSGEIWNTDFPWEDFFMLKSQCAPVKRKCVWNSGCLPLT